MAIFALGIMPYISASIIIQLMTTVFPELEALKKEGEAGRKVINQYTRYFTVALAMVQAYGIAIGLEHFGGQATIVIHPGLFFRIGAVITLTGGTMLLMWIGEQITSRGVGNGISLIIFAGIVARLSQHHRPDPGTGAHRRHQPAAGRLLRWSSPRAWSPSSSSWSGRSAACSSPIPSARSATRSMAAIARICR